jgi:biopolymer transport protein ExbD/biopolymer transport protein TolR
MAEINVTPMVDVMLVLMIIFMVSAVEMYIGDAIVPASELEAKIKAIRATRSETDNTVFLRGDRDVCYTDMMKLLGTVRAAGFKANIVILPEQG